MTTFFQNLTASLSFKGAGPTFFIVKVGGYEQELSMLSTLPSQLDVSMAETYPYKVDCSNYMSGSDTVTVQQAHMFVRLSGAEIPKAQWFISSSVVGNIATVFINCGGLQLGWKYQLQTTVVLNTNKIMTFATNITVVA